MTKQPTSTSRKRTRVGYRNKPKGPDWSVDGEYLVWNRGEGVRIHTDIAGFDPFYFSTDKYAILERQLFERRVEDIKKKINKQLSEEDCDFISQTAADWKIEDYFEIGARILASDQLSDVQKMLFLEPISDLQGFKYGRDVSKLLTAVRWRSAAFIDRWNEYVKLAKALNRLDGFIPAIEIDDGIVQGLPDSVRVYRAFNVPHNKSIRHSREWYRQDFGTGPYYSLSSMIALGFACRQKSTLGRRAIEYGDLNEFETQLFEGKIVIAEYSVPRAKIVRFNHALKNRLESECICNPRDVSLRNYKFCGIDKFLEWRKWNADLDKRLHPLNNKQMLEIAKEIAFTSV